ncbi:MAG: hypothetical protein NW220_15215 [Leptolyngbyaceae cyanobacterium bins.349]|nr:hypothetical protein [Leptolyngbyaceae cyanobacterium bins.349]
MTVIALVVINNFLFGLACLWIARKIWLFRRKVAVIAERILSVEQTVHRVLYPAPNAIAKAQRSTSRLRERYVQLGIQYERVQQIVSILSLVQLFMRYGRVLRPVGRSPNTASKR